MKVLLIMIRSLLTASVPIYRDLIMVFTSQLISQVASDLVLTQSSTGREHVTMSRRTSEVQACVLSRERHLSLAAS